MIRLDEVIQLKDGEEVRALTRRHVITLVPHLLAAAILIVAPFFFLFPLFTSGPSGVMVFGVLVCVGILIAIRSVIMWDGDLIIVTNHRLIDVDQQGIFARTINEILYGNMQDPAWSKSTPLDFLLGIGRVSARSSSGSLMIEAKHVPNPKELHQLISELAHKAMAAWTSGGTSSTSTSSSGATAGTSTDDTKRELVDRVSKQIANMDEEALKKLADTLKGNAQDIAIAKVFGDKTGSSLKEMKE